MNPANSTTTSAYPATQWTIVQQRLRLHGWQDGGMRGVTLCLCDHKLHGTGGVFFQSAGLIACANCDGWQLIRKPLV